MALGSLTLIPQSVQLLTLVGGVTLMVTLILAPATRVPDEGDTEHQVPGLPGKLLPPVQLRVALPVLAMFIVWLGGVEPPETPVKVKLEGVRVMVGAVTVNKPAEERKQPVAPLVLDQPLPEIPAVPPLWPVTVLPKTLATLGLLLLKLPPLKPAEAEAVAVPPIPMV